MAQTSAKEDDDEEAEHWTHGDELQRYDQPPNVVIHLSSRL